VIACTILTLASRTEENHERAHPRQAVGVPAGIPMKYTATSTEREGSLPQAQNSALNHILSETNPIRWFKILLILSTHINQSPPTTLVIFMTSLSWSEVSDTGCEPLTFMQMSAAGWRHTVAPLVCCSVIAVNIYNAGLQHLTLLYMIALQTHHLSASTCILLQSAPVIQSSLHDSAC
jgi:hypothetical protein